MEVIYEETDPDAMTSGSTASSSTVATWHLAQLKEKLEKLLQAPSTSINMEIDKKELKKCACTLHMCTDQASMPAVTIEYTTPEEKIMQGRDTSTTCESKSTIPHPEGGREGGHHYDGSFNAREGAQ